MLGSSSSLLVISLLHHRCDAMFEFINISSFVNSCCCCANNMFMNVYSSLQNNYYTIAQNCRQTRCWYLWWSLRGDFHKKNYTCHEFHSHIKIHFCFFLPWVPVGVSVPGVLTWSLCFLTFAMRFSYVIPETKIKRKIIILILIYLMNRQATVVNFPFPA